MFKSLAIVPWSACRDEVARLMSWKNNVEREGVRVLNKGNVKGKFLS